MSKEVYNKRLCSHCQIGLRVNNSSYCREHRNLTQKLWRKGLRLTSTTGAKRNGIYIGKSLAPLQIDVQPHFHEIVMSDEEIRHMVRKLKLGLRWIPWLYERAPP